VVDPAFPFFTQVPCDEAVVASTLTLCTLVLGDELACNVLDKNMSTALPRYKVFSMSSSNLVFKEKNRALLGPSFASNHRVGNVDLCGEV
jgi:hypothetical protein